MLQHLLRPAAAPLRGLWMAGVPFQKGSDPRRNLAGRGSTPRAKTLRELAAADRESNFDALKKLRDEAEDERVRLEAAKTLAAYSDNKPSEGVSAPEQPKDTSGEDAEVLKLLTQAPEETNG